MATDTDGAEFRIEHDSMGEVRVPAWAKWRAQTQRAVENFPISGTPIEPALIHALGEVTARNTMNITLSCDHRILYGADAAEFLARIKALLEQPIALAL